jgi:hypothetical protein
MMETIRCSPIEDGEIFQGGQGMKGSKMAAIVHRGIYRWKEAVNTCIRPAKAVKDPEA